MGKQFHDVSSPRGAPMGRGGLHEPPQSKVRLFRVRLDAGGYDDGGAYWGLGPPLYCATDDYGFRTFLRAASREAAKREVLADNPGVTFWR